jgi:sugar/nucleoside kinase (ribokinase family)
MTGTEDLDEGLARLAPQVKTLVVTRSEKGAVALENGERAEVAAEPVAKVVDTTGAGDLFAAGFLYGHVRGENLERRLRLGGIAAAEVISHFGARPEADLKALVSERVG